MKTGIEALRAQWEVEGLSVNRRRQLQGVAEGMLLNLMEQLAQVRVLDAACGAPRGAGRYYPNGMSRKEVQTIP